VSRERQPLTRAAILAEARAVVADAGLGALTLRGLARRLDVTAPALYLHFESKDELVRAVAEDEFEQLITRLERAVEGVSDPIEQIRVQSRAYVAHAIASPTLLEVLFIFRPAWTPSAVAKELPLASKAFAIAAAPVEDAIAQGRLRDPDALVAALTLWAAVHGIASLLAASPQFGNDAETALVDSVIDTVLIGLATERGDD
jgi:AcrR family transcriptional regulator